MSSAKIVPEFVHGDKKTHERRNWRSVVDAGGEPWETEEHQERAVLFHLLAGRPLPKGPYSSCVQPLYPFAVWIRFPLMQESKNHKKKNRPEHWNVDGVVHRIFLQLISMMTRSFGQNIVGRLC